MCMIFAACHDAIVKYNIDPPPLFAKSEVDKNVLVYYHQDRTVRKNVLTEKTYKNFMLKLSKRKKKLGRFCSRLQLKLLNWQTSFFTMINPIYSYTYNTLSVQWYNCIVRSYVNPLEIRIYCIYSSFSNIFSPRKVILLITSLVAPL